MAQLPTPAGWYAVATSGELRPGSVRAARIGDLHLVLWRTRSGQVRAAEAWCPHLGAHLGTVGAVRGELLECGFHGFCFDALGTCTATGYGGRVPPRAALSMRPVDEVAGAVLCWYEPSGAAPSFTIPPVPLEGFGATAWRRLEFPGHPLETTENSVDLGHLRWIHGYREVSVVEPATADGPTLRVRYRMTRGGPLGVIPTPPMRTDFEVGVHGLGYSQVDLGVETIGARLRLLVLPTPLGAGMLELRLGVSAAHGAARGAARGAAHGAAAWGGGGRRDVRRAAATVTGRPLQRPAALAWVPDRLLARLARDLTLAGLSHDVGQDRRVWASKRHLTRPMLADGDGPILLYRRWAAQFFAGVEEPPAEVPHRRAQTPLASSAAPQTVSSIRRVTT